MIMGDIPGSREPSPTVSALSGFDPDRVCSNCAWWSPGWEDKRGPQYFGVCRGAPPTGTNGRAVWPQTRGADWCALFASGIEAQRGKTPKAA